MEKKNERSFSRPARDRKPSDRKPSDRNLRIANLRIANLRIANRLEKEKNHGESENLAIQKSLRE